MLIKADLYAMFVLMIRMMHFWIDFGQAFGRICRRTFEKAQIESLREEKNWKRN